MPCANTAVTAYQKMAQEKALKRLAQQLGAGEVRITLSAQGAVAFSGWQDRSGLADVCAYRRLLASNSPELRRAVMRAEALAGCKVNAQLVAAGVHSHDGGHTWHDGH